MSLVVDPDAGATAAIVPSVDAAPESQAVAWRHRHLLDVDGLSAAEIELVMRTTDAMREVLARPIAKVPALRGRQVTILFYEASTRTRVSFEVAAKNLSADVVNIAAASSSVSKGESLVDTVRTVEALGAQMLVMRHSVSGAPYLAAEIFGGSVLNGGDGWHAHPTQALLDLYTMRERLPGGSLAGRKVVILGDVLHSRVARSNIWTLTAAGADLWLCGPATLLRGFEAWAGRGAAAGRRFHVTTSVDEALRDADVVMALRIQRERMASGLLPSLREYAARYGLTRERLALAQPGRAGHASGPDERGRRDRARRRRRRPVGHHRAGHQRRRGPDGAALPARRDARDRGRRDRRRVSGSGPDLEISRAWLVDPAAGREGPGEIVVRDGILEAVTWLSGAEADGVGPDGVVVAPGFIDLHAHLREPGNEDAETVASGLAAAAHGGFTTVCAMPNTTPALDEPGVLAGVRAAAEASGSPVELLAIGAVTLGRGGEQLAALGELADAGVVGFSDDGSPVRSASILRAALAYAGALGLPIVDHAEEPSLTDGRRGERRVRGDRAGAARLAGRGRGDGRRARPRDPGRRRP